MYSFGRRTARTIFSIKPDGPIPGRSVPGCTPWATKQNQSIMDSNKKGRLTSTLNVRIAPESKAALSAQSQSLGIPLSEHVQDILGQHSELLIEHRLLQARLLTLKTELEALRTENQNLGSSLQQTEQWLRQYENLADPFVESIGEGLFLKKRRHSPRSRFEIISLLINNYKKS